MSLDPAATTASDRATSAPALLVPTAPVSVSEIAEFLRHLTELRISGREGDPDARAAFLHRKTELLTRLGPDPSTPAGAPAPGQDTP
jgi:hypothetical protein